MAKFTTPCQFPFTPQGEWNCDNTPQIMLTIVGPPAIGVVYLHTCPQHAESAARTAQGILAPSLN